MNEIFEVNKDKPPLIKNQPPVAGSIYWERSLFHRIKHTMSRFLEVPEMLESEQGKEVRAATIHHTLYSRYSKMLCEAAVTFLLNQAKAKYLEVGMRMRDYEVKKYERWREETEQSLPLLMKRNLLVMETSKGTVTGSQAQTEVVSTSPIILITARFYSYIC